MPPCAPTTDLTKGGFVTLDTLVWREGRSSWDKAADVAEIRPVVEAVPADEIRCRAPWHRLQDARPAAAQLHPHPGPAWWSSGACLT